MKRALPDLTVDQPAAGEKVTLVLHADGKQYDLPVLGGTHGPCLLYTSRCV